MQGNILIVDSIVTNRIVLKVKLKKAFYDVLQVTTMAEAVRTAGKDAPDLIIAGLSLPDGGAATLCERLRQDPRTEHVPVLGIGCQPDRQARVAALKAGVHDVLYQPVDETFLLGRVRNLIRTHNTAAEWQIREDTCRALGLAEPKATFEEQGRCVMVGSDLPRLQSFAKDLRPVLRTTLTLATPGTLMQQVADEDIPDVFVLVLPRNTAAAIEEMRLISTLRATSAARHTGLIVLQTSADTSLAANALDLGADDVMTDGFDAVELALRVRAVMRQKRLGEHLRASVRNSLQAAVFDPLTSLYNRRYAMPHLGRVAAHARSTGRSFAVMAADLDHFKRINDVYGHASGDAVLKEVAKRLRSVMRNTDMVARVGGEEFMIVMPGASRLEAQHVADRICQDISATAFSVPGNATPIEVTISIGLEMGGMGDALEGNAETLAAMIFDRADRALYVAKGRGRNQVKMARPAA